MAAAAAAPTDMQVTPTTTTPAPAPSAATSAAVGPEDELLSGLYGLPAHVIKNIYERKAPSASDSAARRVTTTSTHVSADTGGGKRGWVECRFMALAGPMDEREVDSPVSGTKIKLYKGTFVMLDHPNSPECVIHNTTRCKLVDNGFVLEHQVTFTRQGAGGTRNREIIVYDTPKRVGRGSLMQFTFFGRKKLPGESRPQLPAWTKGDVFRIGWTCRMTENKKSVGTANPRMYLNYNVATQNNEPTVVYLNNMSKMPELHDHIYSTIANWIPLRVDEYIKMRLKSNLNWDLAIQEAQRKKDEAAGKKPSEQQQQQPQQLPPPAPNVDMNIGTVASGVAVASDVGAVDPQQQQQQVQMQLQQPQTPLDPAYEQFFGGPSSDEYGVSGAMNVAGGYSEGGGGGGGYPGLGSSHKEYSFKDKRLVGDGALTEESRAFKWEHDIIPVPLGTVDPAVTQALDKLGIGVPSYFPMGFFDENARKIYPLFDPTETKNFIRFKKDENAAAAAGGGGQQQQQQQSGSEKMVPTYKFGKEIIQPNDHSPTGMMHGKLFVTLWETSLNDMGIVCPELLESVGPYLLCRVPGVVLTWIDGQRSAEADVSTPEDEFTYYLSGLTKRNDVRTTCIMGDLVAGIVSAGYRLTTEAALELIRLAPQRMQYLQGRVSTEMDGLEIENEWREHNPLNQNRTSPVINCFETTFSVDRIKSSVSFYIVANWAEKHLIKKPELKAFIEANKADPAAAFSKIFVELAKTETLEDPKLYNLFGPAVTEETGAGAVNAPRAGEKGFYGLQYVIFAIRNDYLATRGLDKYHGDMAGHDVVFRNAEAMLVPLVQAHLKKLEQEAAAAAKAKAAAAAAAAASTPPPATPPTGKQVPKLSSPQPPPSPVVKQPLPKQATPPVKPPAAAQKPPAAQQQQPVQKPAPPPVKPPAGAPNSPKRPADAISSNPLLPPKVQQPPTKKAMAKPAAAAAPPADDFE